MKRASKVATNLTADGELIRRGRRLRLNFSQIFEVALAQAIRKREREGWLAENEDAIAGYNARVAKKGVFSDRWRRF
jgi:antitoxin CcdA